MLWIVLLQAAVLRAGDAVLDSLWREGLRLAEAGGAAPDADAEILLDRRWYAFAESARGLVLVERVQRVVRVHTSGGVERFNKVILPFREGDSLLALRVATRPAEGAWRETDPGQALKEVSDLQDRGAHRLLAVEGLVPGGLVAYAYAERREAPMFGREIWQRNLPVRQVDFRLTAPEAYRFGTRGYNGFPDASDRVEGPSRVLEARSAELPPAYRERYARYEPHLMRLDWRLVRHELLGPEDAFRWEVAARRFHDAVYDLRERDRAAVRRFVATLAWPRRAGPGQKAALIERAIKETVALAGEQDGLPEAPADVLELRYASRFGMARLTAACLEAAGVPHELVLCGDGEGIPPDPDFPYWNGLTEIAFRIPDDGAYLDPVSDAYRYGLVPPAWTTRPALHVRRSGDRFDIRWAPVPEVPMEAHMEELLLDVRLAPDHGSLLVDARRTFSGYRASVVQPYWERLDAETHAAVARDILLSGAPDGDLEAWTAEGGNLDAAYGGQPFRLSGSVRWRSPLERGGPRLLVKLGELIGPQVELYAERPRQWPIDVDYPHGYRREIRLRVPEGYRVAGWEDLAMDREVRDAGGSVRMAFRATPRLRGSELVVLVEESYRDTTYPVSADEAFRSVINAAADFNKKAVVLLPEAGR
jgi:hypothetical protein